MTDDTSMPERPDDAHRLRGEGSSDRAERVRSSRIAHHRRWADLQIEEAVRRGDFEGLRGQGRPLDLGDGRDRDWWLRKLIERERIEGPAHPALALRLEDARLDETLDAEISEREVRHRVEEFNRRVREARRQLTGGPPVITRLRDVDEEVRRWRRRLEDRRDAQREARRKAADAPRRGSRSRPRRRGLSLRRRRSHDDAGVARTQAVSLVALAVLVALVLAAVSVLALRSAGPSGTAAQPPVTPRPEPAAGGAPAGAATRIETGERLEADRCSTARRAFRPVAVSIPGVRRDVEVVYPARSGGIPGTPPLSDEGKTQMAFDVENGIAPGAAAGNALFNAHTWPDGSALGNRLLADLEVGDRLEVRGTGDRLLCYRLARRVEVPATVTGAQYYRRDGDPRLAIVVCSGTRSSAGEWSHRTLFFAAPVA